MSQCCETRMVSEVVCILQNIYMPMHQENELQGDDGMLRAAARHQC